MTSKPNQEKWDKFLAGLLDLEGAPEKETDDFLKENETLIKDLKQVYKVYKYKELLKSSKSISVVDIRLNRDDTTVCVQYLESTHMRMGHSKPKEKLTFFNFDAQKRTLSFRSTCEVEVKDETVKQYDTTPLTVVEEGKGYMICNNRTNEIEYYKIAKSSHGAKL